MKEAIEYGKRYILVCHCGFVLVGVLENADDLHFMKIRDSAVIRRWGTYRGLGQLAIEGPQDRTILERQPDGVVRREDIIFGMLVDEDRWK